MDVTFHPYFDNIHGPAADESRASGQVERRILVATAIAPVYRSGEWTVGEKPNLHSLFG